MVFRRNNWILCSFNLLISVSFKFSEISMYYFCTKTVIMKIICTWVYVDFPSSKEVKNLPANAGDARDVGLIPGSEISPGGGNGHLLQYSCLGNPWTKEHGKLQSTGSQRSDMTWWLNNKSVCIHCCQRQIQRWLP